MKTRAGDSFEWLKESPKLRREEEKTEQNEIIPALDISVSVEWSEKPFSIDFNKDYFTEIEPFFKNEGDTDYDGIKGYYSLNKLVDKLNTFKNLKNRKEKNPAILKGIYDGGTQGVDCLTQAPFLFFDIDVKNGEDNGEGVNEILFNEALNIKVFDDLSKIALVVFRSHSKRGIAGILVVSGMEEFDWLTSKMHSIVGDAINDFLIKEINKNIGVTIQFDSAQNRFRQIRFLAEQEEEVFLNKDFAPINFELIEKEKLSSLGVPLYTFNKKVAINGSIKEQYNSRNDIRQVALACGFEEISEGSSSGKIRVKHRSSSSKSSGYLNLLENRYYNFSESFSHKTVFDPFNLKLDCDFSGNYKNFMSTLEKQGYKEYVPTEEDYEKALERIQKTKCEKEIFKECFHLRNGKMEEKIRFSEKAFEILEGKVNLEVFYTYLKLNNLKITYDHSFEIEKYVSEVLGDIISLSDKNQRILCSAETGTGKTTAFIEGFPSLLPDKQILILEPLTAIVDQFSSQYPNVVGLTGESSMPDHRKAIDSKIVVATYQQGQKLLEAGRKFDYIVIDEIHNLITSISYKRDDIEKLTNLLNKERIIGLTGTPIQTFKRLGYTFLHIRKRNHPPTKIVQRVSNKPAEKIILGHLEESVSKGKTIVRANEITALTNIKDVLIKKMHYKEEEVLCIYSDTEIKKSEAWLHLVQIGKFPDEVKFVLTSSVLDEGISIEQLGFTDVVFIETSYYPRPEQSKQFFARFRNYDPQRVYYHYKKIPENYYWKEIDEDGYFDGVKSRAINKTVNPYLLAFEASSRTFSSLIPPEYDTFLSLNYNLKFVVDKEWNQSNVDTTGLTEIKQEKAEKIWSNWLSDTQSCLSYTFLYTKNKSLEKQLESKERPPSKPYISKLVKNNLKAFEKITSNYLILKKLNEEPNKILFEEGKYLGERRIKNIVTFLGVKKILDSPEGSREKGQKVKMDEFFKKVKKAEAFGTDDLVNFWKPLKNAHNLTKNHLLELVKLRFKVIKVKSGIYRV